MQKNCTINFFDYFAFSSQHFIAIELLMWIILLTVFPVYMIRARAHITLHDVAHAPSCLPLRLLSNPRCCIATSLCCGKRRLVGIEENEMAHVSHDETLNGRCARSKGRGDEELVEITKWRSSSRVRDHIVRDTWIVSHNVGSPISIVV